MNNIEEAKQAVYNICKHNCEEYERDGKRYCNCENMHGCSSKIILDQFIVDTEKLIKENEELKKEYCKMCQSIYSKNDIEMYCETCAYKESENSND